jgi:predicted nucleotidyltransferase
MNPSGPGPARNHDVLTARFVEACAADARIVAALVGGSIARGEADEYSDIDLCLIATDEAYEVVLAERANLIAKLGEPLFLEDFELDGIAFFILPDGTEVELFFERENGLHEIHTGPFRVLLDKKGILAGAEFPGPEPGRADQVDQLRRILSWFWHDLSHLIAALGRGQLWWASGQLEALRAYCINLARIEQNAEAQEEAYEKLDQAISTTQLSALRATFGPMEPDAMLRAALDILAFYRERAPVVAQAYGLTYPVELDQLMSGRLDLLARTAR